MLFPIISTVLVKTLWKMNIRVNGAYFSFGNRIDILEYTKLFFGSGNPSKEYYPTVVNNFKTAFFDKTVPVFQAGIPVSYSDIIIINFVLFYITYLVLKKKDKIENKILITELIIIGLSEILYVFYLGAVYMSNFSQFEAVNLASYERYINIVLFAIQVFISISIFDGLQYINYKNMGMVLLLSGLMLISPTKVIMQYLNGEYKTFALQRRSQFWGIDEKIRKFCNTGEKVYFVSQHDSGFNYWIVRFDCRPIELGAGYDLNSNIGWSLSYKNGSQDENITFNISPDDWLEIIEENYDYLALFFVDDSFIEDYKSMFETPEDIRSGEVYKINSKTGLLELLSEGK